MGTKGIPEPGGAAPVSVTVRSCGDVFKQFPRAYFSREHLSHAFLESEGALKKRGLKAIAVVVKRRLIESA
jgi:hypothetical protein